MQVVPLGTCRSSIIISAMDKEQKPLRCPRCDSANTKFCYYNNHSLSQPRHFCKSCKRYWTRGGTLRNIPIGGGSRKNKRIKQCSRPLATTFQDTSIGSTGVVYQPSIDQKYSNGVHSLYMNGSLQQQPSSCVTPSYALEPPHEFGGLGLGLSSNRAVNNDGTGVYRNDYNMSSSSKQMIHNLSNYYTNTFGSSSYSSSSSAVTLSTISTLLSSRPQSIPQQQISTGADGRTKGLLGGMFLKEMKLQNGQCWEADGSQNKGEIETLVDSSPSAQCLSRNGSNISSWLGPYNGIGTSSSSSES